MGARTHEVLAIVATEYSGVIVYGVLCGAILGLAASDLFVPFFHFTDDPSKALPPFVPRIVWEQMEWIALVFAGTLVVSQFIILYGVTRRNAFQVLRMGEGE